MAKFSLNEVANYGGQGGAGYFSLKNFGDTARVRFLYDKMDDIEGYSVHEVMYKGKKRYIDCIKTYEEDACCCPFCKADKPQMAKIFIPLYSEDEDKVLVWERGKTYIKKIAEICEKVASDKSFAATVFEIKKIEVEGSSTGTFEITPIYEDGTTVADLGVELPKVLGNLVMERTFEEMENYLTTGDFLKEEKIDYSDWLLAQKRRVG